MLAKLRREKIIEFLEKDGSVKAEALSRTLKVSTMTINRDLTLLEKEGLVKRTFGGTIPAYHTSIIQSGNQRLKSHPAEKTKMANKAAELIQSGDTVFIDGSTTSVFLAKRLKDFNKLTVVTNSLAIANELDGATGITLISTGGKYKSETMTWVGSYAELMLKDINVDKSFISSDGIHLKRGVSEIDIDNAAIKKTVVESSGEVVLMLDTSKFNKVFLAKIADLSQIGILITDKKINKDMREGLKKAKIKVIVAS